MCVLYPYPEGSLLTFLKTQSNVIERNITSGNELLILGDFNIKSDTINTPEAQTLGDFLDLFNLQNHVTFPTHNKGHTLNLVLMDINSTTLTKVTQGDFTSDHCFVDCELAIQRNCRETNGHIVETSKRWIEKDSSKK